ncbi:helix-turn-helix transcriptional regulator [Pseudomonas sp. JQ170]|jgi:DNA-binding CsgD family transcriptional regulator|uniref:response regulator transcription factor n=1 Tax=unclassified Pseudomonas TaxID=196821 RepID=UPI00264E7FB0|nr:helix-turn-helix transcriptional regulator [Pseudomonas sp. JQ170]
MRLSDRETEVLSWVARGLTDREVARRLSIALSTARKHRENVHAKLKVGRASALVARYLCLASAPTLRPGNQGCRRRCLHVNSTCLAAWPRG